MELGHEYKALTVDDSKTTRDMVSFTLKEAGYDVIEAEDGAQALEVLGDQRMDVIITDLNMPNMNGIELNALFRCAHSIKGGGVDKQGPLSKVVENMMQMCGLLDQT